MNCQHLHILFHNSNSISSSKSNKMSNIKKLKTNKYINWENNAKYSGGQLRWDLTSGRSYSHWGTIQRKQIKTLACGNKLRGEIRWIGDQKHGSQDDGNRQEGDTYANLAAGGGKQIFCRRTKLPWSQTLDKIPIRDRHVKNSLGFTSIYAARPPWATQIIFYLFGLSGNAPSAAKLLCAIFPCLSRWGLFNSIVQLQLQSN